MTRNGLTRWRSTLVRLLPAVVGAILGVLAGILIPEPWSTYLWAFAGGYLARDALRFIGAATDRYLARMQREASR